MNKIEVTIPTIQTTKIETTMEGLHMSWEMPKKKGNKHAAGTAMVKGNAAPSNFKGYTEQMLTPQQINKQSKIKK